MLRDVLRDTWAYQEIMQEGLEAERKQRLHDQRQILMTIMQTRFAQLAPLVKKHADGVTDPEVLQKVVLQVLTMQDEDQVKQAILSMGSKKTRPKKKKK